MRYPIDAPILAHEQLADYEFEITVHAPPVAEEARPGQFVQVLYDRSYNPFTRRPFSVYRVDKEKGIFSIVYLARGVFTQGMRKKRVGETLSVVGPLGNWYIPDPDLDVTHILVGGGVGAPPLYFLAHELVTGGKKDLRVIVINGARTESLLVATREFAELDVELYITTNDGSRGMQGLVTDQLVDILARRRHRCHVYACGPTAMLRAVGDLCIARGIPCQVSVETVMPCGLGVCMGCVVKIKDKYSPTGFSYLRSCYEGPVFRAEEIIWDE